MNKFIWTLLLLLTCLVGCISSDEHIDALCYGDRVQITTGFYKGNIGKIIYRNPQEGPSSSYIYTIKLNDGKQIRIWTPIDTIMKIDEHKLILKE